MIVLGFCSCQKELSQTDASPVEVDVYVAGIQNVKYYGEQVGIATSGQRHFTGFV